VEFDGMAKQLHWVDVTDIAIELEERHPDVDVVNLRFTDLWKWVQELPDFADDPKKSNEKILEAIQMAWLDERD
jgi:FeS assembly protein IscX